MTPKRWPEYRWPKLHYVLFKTKSTPCLRLSLTSHSLKTAANAGSEVSIIVSQLVAVASAAFVERAGTSKIRFWEFSVQNSCLVIGRDWIGFSFSELKKLPNFQRRHWDDNEIWVKNYHLSHREIDGPLSGPILALDHRTSADSVFLLSLRSFFTFTFLRSFLSNIREVANHSDLL